MELIFNKREGIEKVENQITKKEMEYIYTELQTPYKYGMVVTQIGDEENVEIDCPGVYKFQGKWYMTFVSHNSRSETGGYRTHLASSSDLLHWNYEGCVFDNKPDYPQCAAFPALQDISFGGSNELECIHGRYWWTTMEGSVKGYEGEPMNIGLLSTQNPSTADRWRHEDGLLLSVDDSDVREERKTLYKSTVIHDTSQITGYPYVMYYNAKDLDGHTEKIFIAGSNDMIHWKRLGDSHALCIEGHQITGDPQIVKINDLWVMNLYGYTGKAPAYDTFAASRDLLNWTLWDGQPTISASEEYDSKHAHKPWIIKENGVTYHFYCARSLDNRPRGIALATSINLLDGRI